MSSEISMSSATRAKIHYHTEVFNNKKLGVIGAGGFIGVGLVAAAALMYAHIIPCNQIAMWAIGGAGGAVLGSSLLYAGGLVYKHRAEKKPMREKLDSQVRDIETKPSWVAATQKHPNSNIYILVDDLGYPVVIDNPKEGDTAIHIYKPESSLHEKKCKEMQTKENDHSYVRNEWRQYEHYRVY